MTSWVVESKIETTRGNECIVVRSEQGLYKFSKVNRRTDWYRCTNRKCGVSITVLGGERVVKWTARRHTHPGMRESKYCLDRLKTACKQFAMGNLGKKPLEEIMRDVYDIASHSLPDSKQHLLKKAVASTKKLLLKYYECSDLQWRLQAASRKEGETIILDDDDYEDDDNIDESTEGESSCYLPDENSGTVVFAEAHSSLISEVGTTEPEPDVKPTLPHSKRIKRELELTMDTDEESSRTTIADDSDGVVAASPLSDLRMVRIKREAVTGSVPELVTVKQETSEEDTQVSETVEVDEDKKFLDDLLPMIKKLKPSDKAMVKAQIIQLINWRLNSTV